jgi:acyl-CoA thioester hydrolase
MRAAGLPYTDVEREGVQMPVAELYVRYHRPVSYDQLLEVWAWVSELTPVRVRFEYRLCLGGESRALTTGHTVHAFVDGRGQVTRLDRRPELWARVREAAGRLGPAG